MTRQDSTSLPSAAGPGGRPAELVAARLAAFGGQCDRIFAAIALAQWVGAIAASLWLSPLAWVGSRSYTHPHVYAALFLGGLLTSLPVLLAWRAPGRAATRHAVAVSQMLWGSLLIHLTGGRIETHFHVFVSLAFLAWYRDWRVLATAAAVAVADHALRGALLPASIYGTSAAGLWRTAEHAFWVLCEGGFLLVAVARSLGELRETCRMQAAAEGDYERVEAEVRRQTAGLQAAEARARDGEAFLARVGQVAGVGGWRLDVATMGISWTDQTCRIQGVPPGHRPTLDEALAFYAPEARPVIARAVEEGVTNGTPWDLELPMVTAAGARIVVRAVGAAEFDGGRPVRLVGALQDITERKRVEDEVRKLSFVVQQTPASVVITDLTGAIEYVNPAFVEATGYAATDVVGANVRVLKSGLMPPETYADMWRELSAGRGWRGELQNRRKDGTLFWELAVISALKNAAGATTHFMAVKENITARKAMEDELRSAARTDRLTGLPNRGMLAERLQRASARAAADPAYRFAVLFLDFDRFKAINDGLGHEAGDELLRQIAGRLRAAVNPADSLGRDVRGPTVARLGGDEFVVLLDGIGGPGDATAVADRTLAALRPPYRLGAHEAYSTASIGIVTSDPAAGPAASADDLLRDADAAMYEAKLAGRGRYVVFDASMRERVRGRLTLESDLRGAMGGAQLSLEYQPIVCLSTGRVEAFEALLRWRHPDRGTVPAAEFLPVAEATGLIVPIGGWALREAAAQLARWRADLGPTAPAAVAVNLSRQQLRQPGLVDVVRDALAATGTPAACLRLKVAEGAVAEDAAAAGGGTLAALRAMGVKVAIDGFGTGSSSLASLHRWPIDVLKIDRSFVANLDRGRDCSALVQAVAQLARNLNVAVVAEGVETADQAVMLQSLDCGFGQGNLFGRPMPAAMVPSFTVPPRLLAGQPAAADVAVAA
jgi:diguanylate cyclase (GGDEF)-like protein/PAS domain S-box-containing protein